MSNLDFEGFKQWLRRRGRSENTVVEYVRDLTNAFECPEGPVGFLLDDAAPKTRHRRKAVLAAWAKFAQDENLENELEEVSLPAASIRTQKAMPWPAKDLEKIRLAVDAYPRVPSAIRAILGLMSWRGFRVGDLLRLRREDIQSALRDGVLKFQAKRGRMIEWGVAPKWRRYLDSLRDTKTTVLFEVVEKPDTAVTKYDLVRLTATARARVAYYLERVVDSAKLSDEGRIHPHRLRRTYAVRYLEQLQKHGMGIVELKDHMQWADIGTAAQYVDHARRTELDKIAEEMEGEDE